MQNVGPPRDRHFAAGLREATKTVTFAMDGEKTYFLRSLGVKNAIRMIMKALRYKNQRNDLPYLILRLFYRSL